jgi:hypothetical protein
MTNEHNPEESFYCMQCGCWHCYAEGFWPGVESFTAYQQREQQLAQAREENERLTAQNATMHALLGEAQTKPSTYNWGQGEICEFCHGWLVTREEFLKLHHHWLDMDAEAKKYGHPRLRPQGPAFPPHEGHSEQCFYTRLRAFLAEYP